MLIIQSVPVIISLTLAFSSIGKGRLQIMIQVQIKKALSLTYFEIALYIVIQSLSPLRQVESSLKGELYPLHQKVNSTSMFHHILHSPIISLFRIELDFHNLPVNILCLSGCY